MSQKHDRDAAQSDAAYAGMHPQLAADETWADRGLGGSDAMTDDEPKSFSMEEAMQAIRDALGHRESLKPQSCNNQLQRELIPNLPRDDDFFVKRFGWHRRKESPRC
jgi:hypothetical protein